MTPRWRRSRSSPRNWQPPRVTEVREGSPCSGRVQAGDLLLEIDGSPPRDVLDYLEACDEGPVCLRVGRDKAEIAIKINKDPGVPLGLVFDEAVFDGVNTCRNHCIFCFVDQMPTGLRPTLYVKDDDYRLSFYYGNFITLNNLSREEMKRIRRLRLSPLYVSLHSSDPTLRSYIMGGGGEAGLKNLKSLLDGGIEIHLQVVVCPGVNDGGALRTTLRDVMDTCPAASLGVVPIGMTSRAGELPVELKPHDRDSSLELLKIVERFQEQAMERFGRRLFFAADEFYILAGRDLPGAEEYERYPQLENGVGMARKFIDEASEAASALEPDAKPVRGVITGVAGECVIGRVLEEAGMNDAEVVVVESRLLGGSVTVTALLGGEDVVAALIESRPAARELLIPESMLREGLFIDDKSVADVERETAYRIIPVEVDGASFISALCGEGG